MVTYTGVKRLQGWYVAFTPTWEGPGRLDYCAAGADLRDRLMADTYDARFALVDRFNRTSQNEKATHRQRS